MKVKMAGPSNQRAPKLTMEVFFSIVIMMSKSESMDKKYRYKKRKNLTLTKNSRKWMKTKIKSQKAKKTNKKKETIKFAVRIYNGHYKYIKLRSKLSKRVRRANIQRMKLTN